MPELTREEKLKLLEKLSPRLQELMTSEDTGATLLYLGQKYHLSDHQVRLLSKILGDVVLGILSITNLPLEISTKAAVDMQIASGLAQDINDLILSPKPAMATPIPAPAPIMKAVPSVSPTSADRYREPTMEAPEIIDLRKTPPAVSKVEPPPLPILSPIPSERQNRGSSISQPNLKDLGEIGTMPVAPAPILPRPPMPTPTMPPKLLIEAEPHKILFAPPKADTYREPVELPPQYIIRPPGLPPTDSPRDVLDLRKDRGEF